MKPAHKAILSIIASAIFLLIASQPAKAADTHVWDGSASGDWSNGDNWDIGTPTSGDSLIFPSVGVTTYSTNNDFVGYSFVTITIQGGGYTLAGNSLSATGSISDTASSGTNIISLILTGGTLVKSGAGTLTLSGANTLSVAVQLSAGTLNLDNATALGTGTLSLAGGTVDNTSGGPLTYANALTFNANITFTCTNNLTFNGAVSIDGKTITVTANTLTIGGIITSPSGQGIAKAGNGTLNLTGNNTYVGGTTIYAGTLTFSGDNGAATSSTGFGVNYGATLTLDNSSANNTNRIGAAGITLNAGNFNFIGTNVASTNASETVGALNISAGSSVVTITPGSGGSTTMTFDSLSRTAGATVLFRGTNLGSAPAANISTLKFTSAPSLTGGGGAADSTTVSIIAGAFGHDSLSGTGTDMVTYNVGNANGLRLLNGAGYTTEYADTIGDTANANVKLSGSVTPSATVTINSLILNSGGAVATSGYTVTIGSGNILALAGNGGINSSTVLGFGANEGIVRATGDLTISSQITGSAGLTANGAGTITITNTSNSYTGATTVTEGTFTLGTSNVLADASTLRVYYGTFSITSYSDTIGAVTLNYGTISGTTGILTGSSYTVESGTISAILAGTGALTKNTTDIVTLSGANTFSGGVTLNYGTLNINSTTALGTGTFTIYNTGCYIDNTSGGALTLSNNNVQTWRRSFTFTGTSSLNLGSGAVTMGANCTVTVSANTLTVGGNIGGAYKLTKAGSGTLTLSGTNTFTGGVTINAGTISVATIGNGGVAGNLGAGTSEAAKLTLGGGTLSYTGATASTDRNFTLTASKISTIEITTAGTTLTISGASTATTGALTKTGSGTLTLSGANLYTGATTISAGTLACGIANTFSASTAVTISSGATLDLAGYAFRAASLTNNGTLKLMGNETVSITPTNASGSLVQYYGVAGPYNLNNWSYDSLRLSSASATTYNLPATITINKNLTIDANNTLDATFNYYNINIAGNWTNSGTFTPYTDTVTFNGTSAQSVTTGGSDWFTITVTNASTDGVTFIDGFTTAFFTDVTPSSHLNFRYQETINTLYEIIASGGLNLNGQATGTRIVLRRYGGTDPNQWEIYPSGGYWTVSYVDVKDSVNSASSCIYPTNSLDSGNNENWFDPTLVKLVSFDAIGYFGKVQVKWETDSEMNTAGFNIYRSEHPKEGYVKINSSLIPGLGSSAVGKKYEFWDYGVTDGITYYYKLEDVEFNGKSTMHGPVVAHPGLDSDNDGMTDDWELYYGLNPNDPTDASLDPDGDGLTNLEEFIQGTDPTVSDMSVGDGLKIIHSDDYGVTLELTTSSFKVEDKVVDGEAYQVIKLPYPHGQTNEVGKPQVPVKGVLLGVPYDSSITSETVSDGEEIFSGYSLSPVPRIHLDPVINRASNGVEQRKDFGELNYKFVKDNLTYTQDEFYPACLAQVSSGGSLRGQDVAKLNIYPIQFNPVTGELKLYKKIRIEVNFGKKAELDEEGTDKLPSQFNSIYKNLFPNYENVKNWKRRPGQSIRQPDSEQLDTYKISVDEEGIYRLTWQDLSDSDIAFLNPKTIKIYNQGIEIPIYVKGETDDSFDYIEFYAEPIHNNRYTSTNIYWLVTDGDKGLRMKIKEPCDSGDTPISFLENIHYEKDKWYEMEIPDMGYVDDHFFDTMLLAPPGWGFSNSVDFTIPISDVADEAVEDTVKIALQGLSYNDLIELDHHTVISLNGYEIDNTYWDGNIEYIRELSVPQDYLIEGNNTITVELPGDTDAVLDEVLANWFEISYWRQFKAKENALKFNNQGEGLDTYTYEISDFTKDDTDIEIFDITYPKEVEYIDTFTIEIEDESDTYTVSFNDALAEGETRDYIVLSSSATKSPLSIVEDEPSDLISTENQADYIIITYEDFYDSVLPLAQHRASSGQGLNVEVVKVGDIYDEFNYGIFSPEAIKDFLEYTYSKWEKPAPTYVLLVGDGTYDYQDNEKHGWKNYVPTYMIHSPEFPEFGETGCDNWFVCFDGEDDILPDMFIGRLPVYLVEQANTIVDKIISYENTPLEDWTKKVTLVADNIEEIFVDMSDGLTDYLEPKCQIEYEINKIYLDNYADPEDCKQHIIDAVNQGTVMLNYVGHGSRVKWADESILTIPDVPFLINWDRLPFITTMTCGNGYFVNPPGFYNCIAEELIYSSSGGAVAVLAPTAVSYPTTQQFLDRGLFESIFVNDNSLIGPATTYGKLKVVENGGESGDGGNVIQTFVLFGDPALELKITPSRIPPHWASDGGKGNSGCFIATAAYGTYMADEVKVLNKFRNEYLLTNPIGKVFVNTYYKISSPIADFIRKHPILKSVVRRTLKPLIWMAKEYEKR